MRRALYLKFLAGYIIFAILSYISIALFMPNIINNYFIRHQSGLMYSEAVHIAETYASKLYTSEISLESVKQQIDALSIYLDAQIWILNPSGRLVLDSSQVLDVNTPIIIENFDHTEIVGNYYSVGTFFGYFNYNALSVLAPIISDFETNGYVVMHYDYGKVLAQSHEIQGILFLASAVTVCLSFVLLIVFTISFYIPLRKITRATEEYAAGNYSFPLHSNSQDELGYLAATLSYMANKIGKNEEEQKKFLANISHDFRSPLTSIRGYLDAILDDTIPPELYGKYINIVLTETDRLRGLTNNLLQLNNLNPKGLYLDLVEFDINKVIITTLATFEGTCNKKNLRVNLILTGEQMMVRGDLSKIQQVLYNLVDNAIKFSFQDSELKIESTEKRNKIYVSVKDYGIGIPKEEIHMIWDRFYKSDSSRGKDKKGTGLGLSICKEIIQSHGEHINVMSTQGAGSEFVFSLPIAFDEPV